MLRPQHLARRSALILASLSLSPLPAFAADSADLQTIRQEFDSLRTQLRQDYENRIADLEQRLKAAEAAVAVARETPGKPAAETAPAKPGSRGNAFNPEIGMVLSGTYANLKRNPEDYRITGFVPGGEIGPGARGFSLGESELMLSANVDQLFYGNLTLAVSPENEVSAEEAFIQTTSLPQGARIKAGRFFSGIGYVNGQHAHTWDFVDSPLVYQAFLGGQYAQDGIQASWIAPTQTFVELGAEAGRGANFPGNTRQNNKPGAQALFAHVGGDVGVSHSWRAGLSWLRHAVQDRSQTDTDLAGSAVDSLFTGRSQLWAADFVWKWAPNGNGERQNLKLQGEYFRRKETGQFAFDTANANLQDAYRASQSGWYLQSVFQFMPAWRIGARYDRLNSGTVDYTSNGDFLANPRTRPSKTSVMVDWSPSEFSRLRLQLARDKSREDRADQQIFLQYQMSLGAHGAHSY
jgi:hypothetical protein